ncbi:predicted protein [Naegleria gruberi]|uniref:Predicted protein n=1 Tax=Naegleria gruberi TaxID=5762 RepID=D2V8F9_NAEGR|nr:uncharacterized protein NAEGRDRAFT_47508 [Naegleria gruberi]EFC46801.1 predicted protein [Naegleria gruberi]|eukprot:XP_002679545.1 predicted protein [Naegleria gruberi strain NEG-M]
MRRSSTSSEATSSHQPVSLVQNAISIARNLISSLELLGVKVTVHYPPELASLSNAQQDDQEDETAPKKVIQFTKEVKDKLKAFFESYPTLVEKFFDTDDLISIFVKMNGLTITNEVIFRNRNSKAVLDMIKDVEKKPKTIYQQSSSLSSANQSGKKRFLKEHKVALIDFFKDYKSLASTKFFESTDLIRLFIDYSHFSVPVEVEIIQRQSKHASLLEAIQTYGIKDDTIVYSDSPGSKKRKQDELVSTPVFSQPLIKKNKYI